MSTSTDIVSRIVSSSYRTHFVFLSSTSRKYHCNLSDGGGEIDKDEMYVALTDAGVDITEEGVLTLVAIIDEDGNGKFDFFI